MDQNVAQNSCPEQSDQRISLPAIPEDANKYSRGSLLILAGSSSFPGAAVLCALAAARTGAGYVTLAVPEPAATSARAHLLSIPVVAAPATSEGAFAANALLSIIKGRQHIDAIVCGPGIMVSPETIAFVQEVMQFAAKHDIPLLLDADALNALALYLGGGAANQESTNTPIKHKATNVHANQESSSVTKQVTTQVTTQVTKQVTAQAAKQAKHAATQAAPLEQQKQLPTFTEHKLTLTPHGGELARLLCATQLQDASMLAQLLRAIVVAKGPATVITDGKKTIESAIGTAALAKAGTGDVLAGIIGSLLAQGMRPFEAALAGVKIHSKAGCLAEQNFGIRSVMAEDVIAAISDVLRTLPII
jgi:NAD(P)H-hydrate epimerase